MRIKTYCFPHMDARMYVIIQNDVILIVDPFPHEEVEKVILERRIKECTVLLTHEHIDHISGVNWLRTQCNCNVICQKYCGDNIKDTEANCASFFHVFYLNASQEDLEDLEKRKLEDYTCYADTLFMDTKEFIWEGYTIKMIASPGHTEGSCCILIDDKILFTGDSLVNGTKTVTKLPGGSKKDYYEKTLPFLQSLKGDISVYPGHGDAFLLKEWHA